jgi:hypothetical protein
LHDPLVPPVPEVDNRVLVARQVGEVGDDEGALVGLLVVIVPVGLEVGDDEGAPVGLPVGLEVRDGEGALVGLPVDGFEVVGLLDEGLAVEGEWQNE